MHENPTFLLDLGGVVFQSTGLSNQEINWKIITKLNHKYGHDLNIGRDVFPQFLLEYNHLTHQDLSGQQFLEGVFDTLEINAQLIQMVGKLGDIIIVSDNYRENIAYISKRYWFDQWATAQFYSFDFALEKSDPLFFKKLLPSIDQYSEENMIFVDDSPKKIESARLSGITSILFQNNEQVAQELTDLLSVS